jgi:hypothetical protein
MLYQDKNGKIMMSDEVNELSPWEIDELGIHIIDYEYL